ncbi:MAG: hypothetical protein PHR28_11735 [candidate division Zixibacteria bacterium]|nr:hypothetical protein [candidate division Zixibacteria bacterium]
MGIRSLAAKFSLSRVAAKVVSVPLSLPLQLSGRSLLVLLPDNLHDLAVVRQILPQIIRLFGEESVNLLAAPECDIQSIFPTKGIRIITPEPNALNWSRLPSHAFLDRLRALKFDYVFDTNLEENGFAARILLLYPYAVRFGAAGRLGLPYLNLEIKTRYGRDRGLIYECILEVMEHLSHTTGTLTS